MVMGIQTLQALTPEELEEANRRYLQGMWPRWYTNADTRRRYTPHNDVEALMVKSDTPKFQMLRAGEGSGKTTWGVIKDLNRLRRGMDGCLVSPDLVHFQKSLWPEFVRWCPWDMVIERHRYRQEPGRVPNRDFELVFHNELGGFSKLVCGGAIEIDPKRWEGLNINFAHLDEMRRHKTPIIFKTILGRIRIPGPKGEPPQLWITTTPAKHWLYEYFGPMACQCDDCGAEYEWELEHDTEPRCGECNSTAYATSDPHAHSKLRSAVMLLHTEDNEPNTYDGFAEDRGIILTEAERRVLLHGEWEDVEEGQHFLPNIIMWDQCRDDNIPPLSPNDPLILGVDAAKGRDDSYSDCFAIVGVTRHWLPEKRRNHIVVRFTQTWQARPGGRIDFQGTEHNPGPELFLRRMVDKYAVKAIIYDPTELTDMGQRFMRDRVVWMDEFSQRTKRTAADTDLLTLIMSERIVHDGDEALRSHIQNADRKVSDDGHQLRMMKRLDSLKIDLAVALSMAASRCLYLNIA
jgi:hypothetical protein